MFVVYSPEGRSFIGAAQNLPVLKVDPAKRIKASPKASLEDMRMEPDHSNPHFREQAALKQYQHVQQPEMQRHTVVKVEEIMTTPVITMDLHTSIEEAWKLMDERNIHHLPVMENNQLIGMCSRTDVLKRVILNEQGELELAMPEGVVVIMQSEVVTAKQGTEIRQVAMALTQYHIGALPIIDEEEKLVGIVTLSDLVKRLSQQPPVELYI
ncbi:MAG: CBS domain-containing protein [Thiomicrorhabdus chilensis]|uniref:CBS domain-containing protein n=1 Tax=Thiomicrorhabdus chilensis TaxID=63656 RepID=UPI00299E6FAC|nr:CBS domain-containing protein [Thiomicrorhabdus chilensis]MDX1347068.1 CBS domain-containing protein [Thiomicrorhabdus chilensis]